MILIVHNYNKNYTITYNNISILLNTKYSFICFLAFLNKKIIDFDDYHILFQSISCLNLELYSNHCFVILKLFLNNTHNFNNLNDIYHLQLSKKTKFIGNLYTIGEITYNNQIIKYNVYEFIDNMFNIEYINNIKFIDFYSIIIDYLKAIDTIHTERFIHSNIKPIQLMVNKSKVGKLIGFDDIIAIEKDKIFYNNTSGCIEFLANERFTYFINNGFIGNTSIYSDLWELYYSILYTINIINDREDYNNIFNNGNIIYFFVDKLSKLFNINYSDTEFFYIVKLSKIFEIGLNNNPLLRNNASYHISIILNNNFL